jgi:hypothetical protein
MTQKAGFIQRYRCYAYDEQGYPCQIVELTLHGVRYGIRDGEARRALAGRGAARVMSLRQDWQQYLDGAVGRAERFGNARGLIIELTTGERFSVSAESLREVLSRRRAYASVIEIATRLPCSDSTRQQTLAGIA